MTIVAALTTSVGCALEVPDIVLPTAEAVASSALERSIDHMSVEELAGQLLLIGLEEPSAGAAPTVLGRDLAELLQRVQPGGVVLYGPSFASPDQVRSLVSDAQSLLTIPGFVATDYEGGLVSRLTDTGGIPATPIPPARALGRRFELGQIDGAHLRELGAVMGRELRAVGVTMNFAPVVDVDPQGFVGSIGRHGRAFGSNPELVAEAAVALIEGMESQGVAAIAKHFPGHGGVVEDSHYALPQLDASREEIEARELAAFRAVFLREPVGIMTAHMVVPALDPSATPATLSRSMLTTLARDEMGFSGLIVTDALNMAAVRNRAPEAEIAVQAVAAGADLLLKPVNVSNAHAALVDALNQGRLERDAVEASVFRILKAKWKLGILDPFRRTRFPIDVSVIGADAHRAFIDEIMSGEEQAE